jgi:hypothetical protein
VRTMVVPGLVKGSIDSITAGSTSVVITGWAADTTLDRPPDRVLVFVNGRLAASDRPGRRRPDIARAYGEKLERSGYRLTVHTTRTRALADPSRLSVVAVSGRRASSLSALPTAARD